MKNIVLSAVAVLAMSSFAVAGGDIAPVEAPMMIEPVVDDSGFYLGLAYSSLNAVYDDADYDVDTLFDKSWSEIMVLAGYKFNSYVAVEGRYWFGLSEDTTFNFLGTASDGSADAWGVYVKPMYPVTDEFDIYALLGYAGTNITGDTGTFDYDKTLDGFSWGLGASYEFTENIAAFVDYTSLYNDTEIHNILGGINIDGTVDAWNFGVTYKF